MSKPEIKAEIAVRTSVPDKLEGIAAGVLAEAKAEAKDSTIAERRSNEQSRDRKFNKDA